MPNHPNLQVLFAPALQATERTAARAAWCRQAVAALAQAQARLNQAWEQRLAENPDADDATLDALPPPPEQAEVDAAMAEIQAVLDRDQWPRHLYWADV